MRQKAAKASDTGKTKKIQKLAKPQSKDAMEVEGDAPKVQAPLVTSNLSRAKLKSQPRAKIFKQFQQNFIEHKKAFEDTKKLSRGQKKRLSGKQSFLRRKYLDKFIKDLDNKGQDATIDLKEFNTALHIIDQAPLPEASKPTTLSNKAVQRIEKAEALRCQQVVAHPLFQKNPFAVLEAHINNSTKQKGK